jgi:hypothetical protein
MENLISNQLSLLEKLSEHDKFVGYLLLSQMLFCQLDDKKILEKSTKIFTEIYENLNPSPSPSPSPSPVEGEGERGEGEIIQLNYDSNSEKSEVESIYQDEVDRITGKSWLF